MASKEAKRIRRMWSEVSGEPLPDLVAAELAQRLTAECLPAVRADHRAVVLAGTLAAAAERRSEAAEAGFDRGFRELLDQGSARVGTWRILDAVRPHLALLSWTYWATAAILFVLSAFVFPQVAGWGPQALIVTVPLLALVSLLYTVRAGSHGTREWERSFPITPFQIALARTTLVLSITVGAAVLASLVLQRQELGVSLAALTVSWLAPLLLIVGLYMSCDVLIGGMAGPAGAAVAWFIHSVITQGGQKASSVVTVSEGVGISTYDALTLLAGSLLLLISLLLPPKDSEEIHAGRSY